MEVGVAVHDYAERRLRGEHPTIIHPVDSLMAVHSAARVFDRDVLPTYREAVLIEASFQIAVDGIPYSGVIDSVDKRPITPEEHDFPSYWAAETSGKYPTAHYILRDLKTTGSRPAPGKYRLNMIGYWLGATDLGFPPDAMQLDWIVRTKAPYYWPEAMDPVTDEDVDWFAATLQSVSDGVRREDYEPTALGSRACSWCQHRHICGPLSRYNKEVNK